MGICVPGGNDEGCSRPDMSERNCILAVYARDHGRGRAGFSVIGLLRRAVLRCIRGVYSRSTGRMTWETAEPALRPARYAADSGGRKKQRCDQSSAGALCSHGARRLVQCATIKERGEAMHGSAGDGCWYAARPVREPTPAGTVCTAVFGLLSGA